MSVSKEQRKRIIVWAVFIAAVIALIAALILYLRGMYGKNDARTQTVGEVQLSPVAEAYSGAEDILGTTVTIDGEHENEKLVLSFPSAISQYQPEKAYIITNIRAADYDFEKGAEQMKATAPKLFESFYGDKFDAGCMNFMDTDDEYGHQITMHYNGNNGETANLGPSGYSLIEDKDVFADVSINSVLGGVYFYRDDPDKTVQLSDGSLTLKAAADKFSEYLNTKLSDFDLGFELRPLKAQVMDYNGGNTLTIFAEQLYEGIPFESSQSTYHGFENGKESYYLSSWAEADMLSANSFFRISDLSSGNIAKTEPLSEIISLGAAVEILKENLAKNSSYEFTDIKLMYCCKSVQNEIRVWDDKEKINELVEEDNLTERVYRPTWYFIKSEANNMTSGIKVDAVTGEITMDL